MFCNVSGSAIQRQPTNKGMLLKQTKSESLFGSFFISNGLFHLRIILLTYMFLTDFLVIYCCNPNPRYWGYSIPSIILAYGMERMVGLGRIVQSRGLAAQSEPSKAGMELPTFCLTIVPKGGHALLACSILESQSTQTQAMRILFL